MTGLISYRLCLQSAKKCSSLTGYRLYRLSTMLITLQLGSEDGHIRTQEVPTLRQSKYCIKHHIGIEYILSEYIIYVYTIGEGIIY